MKEGYVYFLTNWTNKVLYIGVTNNIERRVVEHQLQTVPGFTQKYNLKKLVYFEYFTDIAYAIEREKQLKKWRRDKKDTLVLSMNPDWNDLFDGECVRSLGCSRDDSL